MLVLIATDLSALKQVRRHNTNSSQLVLVFGDESVCCYNWFKFHKFLFNDNLIIQRNISYLSKKQKHRVNVPIFSNRAL